MSRTPYRTEDEKALSQELEHVAFQARLGIVLLNMVALTFQLGWSDPRGSLDYLQLQLGAPSEDAVDIVKDFVSWMGRNVDEREDAKHRLSVLACSWAPMMADALHQEYVAARESASMVIGGQGIDGLPEA